MPLESVQAIVNASVSASGTRLQVGNVDANLFRVSALGVNISDVSNGDAGDFRTSAVQGDASLLRVSALGVNIADVSNSDAGDFLVSAKQGDAGLLLVSAKQGDGALFRTSAIQEGAGALMVSAKSQDGALMRVSSVQDGAAALNVSAKSDSGATFRVSSLPATQSGAGYSNITGASSVNVLAGKGILKSIVFQTSTTARVVLFDSTSHGANTIATIDGIPTKLTQLNYNAPVSAGITVSAVSAPGDLTITWIAL